LPQPTDIWLKVNNPMNEDNSRKYFDVARPGRSAPSPTARPVITNTTPRQPDPMMHQQPEVQLTPQLPADQPAATETAVAEPAAPPTPDMPAPALGTAVDVVDAHQNFKPLKPTKSRTRQLMTLLIVVLVIAVIALGVYPLVRSKF
jgi:hypothetical protein